MRTRLLQWQWEGYREFHSSALNLWLHIVAVPSFVGAAVSLVAALATTHWVHAASALGSLVIAFALQAIGHKRETVPPVPFQGPGDAITRILAEQFVTFPRFVLSGGWWRALRASGARAAGRF